jgi:hypothetical protein
MNSFLVMCAIGCILVCGLASADEPVWSLDGAWTGVAGHEESGAIYALARQGRCAELNFAGRIEREIKFPGSSGELLRLARLGKDAKPSFLTFGVWGAELRAYDADGEQLWSYPRATGIDDVWAFDLDGDRLDEVIVGYNGGTGLHVLNSKGELLWKTTAIANVWHVGAGHVWGEKTAQVVTTSAAGNVHLFSHDGKKQVDLDPECYGSMVRVGRVSPKDETATIFVGGPELKAGVGPKSLGLNAVAADGHRKWSLALPAKGTAHIDSAALAPARAWLAVAVRGGGAHVVDVTKGEIITTVDANGPFGEVGWAPGKEKEAPLLLIATGRALKAYDVKKP